MTDEQERELTRLARSKRTSVRLAQRAQFVLLAAKGLQNKDIAEQMGIGFGLFVVLAESAASLRVDQWGEPSAGLCLVVRVSTRASRRSVTL